MNLINYNWQVSMAFPHLSIVILYHIPELACISALQFLLGFEKCDHNDNKIAF